MARDQHIGGHPLRRLSPRRQMAIPRHLGEMHAHDAIVAPRRILVAPSRGGIRSLSH
jgi:hypothetical protein